MKDIEAGDYIINKEMEMEGIVVSLREAGWQAEQPVREIKYKKHKHQSQIDG